MASGIFRLLVTLCGLLALSCAPPARPPSVQEQSPPSLRLLDRQHLPGFHDDFDRASLKEAASRHLAYLRRQAANKSYSFGGQSLSGRRLIRSVEALLDKLRENPSDDQLQRFIADNFLVYQAAGRGQPPAGEMLVTGYYEPLFDGSLTPTGRFRFPLHSLPSQPPLPRSDEQPILWSRSEIEDNPRLLHQHELVYLGDPFEVFLLHVQGSGRIRLTDGSIRAVRFAGTNGREYRSIGKLLVDEKKLTLEEATIPGIRDYLRRHPEELRRVLRHNPRYVFFRWGEASGPRGSSGEVLTPGRSVALDGEALPPGPFCFVATRLPATLGEDGTTSRQPLERFVFPQDTGAAIKGTGRIDIFFGSGREAEDTAHRLKEPGQLYFFVHKKEE